MKREFSSRAGIIACVVLLIAFSACGGDDGPTAANPADTGSISGTVSFGPSINDWPTVGNIQVSVWSYWPPNGPPDGFTNPLVKETDFPTYEYKITGLDPGSYAMVTVGWRDPANPTGAKTIGEYLGAAAIVVEKGTDMPGYDISADLTLAKP